MKLKTISSLIAVVTALSWISPARASDQDKLNGHVSDSHATHVTKKSLRFARDIVIGVPVSAVKGSIKMVALGTSFGAEELEKEHMHKVPAVAISGLLLGPGCALFGLVAGSMDGLDESLSEWQSK